MATTDRCGVCGRARELDEFMAMVSDPFLDDSYSVCKPCMRPLHSLRAILIHDSIKRLVTETDGG